MAVLNKDQILAADDLPREIVPVPEWGGDVIVQGLSAEQSETLIKSTRDDNEGFALKLLALSLVNESGEPLFALDTVAALKKKNSGILTRLVQICTRLNQFDRAETAKNSPPDAAATSA